MDQEFQLTSEKAKYIKENLNIKRGPEFKKALFEKKAPSRIKLAPGSRAVIAGVYNKMIEEMIKEAESVKSSLKKDLNQQIKQATTFREKTSLWLKKLNLDKNYLFIRIQGHFIKRMINRSMRKLQLPEENLDQLRFSNSLLEEIDLAKATAMYEKAQTAFTDNFANRKVRDSNYAFDKIDSKSIQEEVSKSLLDNIVKRPTVGQSVDTVLSNLREVSDATIDELLTHKKSPTLIAPADKKENEAAFVASPSTGTNEIDDDEYDDTSLYGAGNDGVFGDEVNFSELQREAMNSAAANNTNTASSAGTSEIDDDEYDDTSLYGAGNDGIFGDEVNFSELQREAMNSAVANNTNTASSASTSEIDDDDEYDDTGYKDKVDFSEAMRDEVNHISDNNTESDTKAEIASTDQNVDYERVMQELKDSIAERRNAEKQQQDLQRENDAITSQVADAQAKATSMELEFYKRAKEITEANRHATAAINAGLQASKEEITQKSQMLDSLNAQIDRFASMSDELMVDSKSSNRHR